jgi:hypothetical protein
VSDHGPGTEIQVTLNDMFYCGRGYMNVYSHSTKEIINQCIYQTRWWGHQIGGLQQSEENLFYRIKMLMYGILNFRVDGS